MYLKILNALLSLILASTHEQIPAPFFTYDISCVGPDGKEKWRETIRNLVTTEGKTDIIDKYFKGASYTAGWYLGLKGSGSPAAGDTLASHAAWSELTPYSGDRPAITFGTTTGGSNTATTLSIQITGNTTVVGAFIASVSSGTSGKLYSVSDFTNGPRAVSNGDTLNVTPSVSML